MVYKKLCVLVLWAKVSSALEGLRVSDMCMYGVKYLVYFSVTEEEP